MFINTNDIIGIYWLDTKGDLETRNFMVILNGGIWCGMNLEGLKAKAYSFIKSEKRHDPDFPIGGLDSKEKNMSLKQEFSDKKDQAVALLDRLKLPPPNGLGLTDLQIGFSPDAYPKPWEEENWRPAVVVRRL